MYVYMCIYLYMHLYSENKKKHITHTMWQKINVLAYNDMYDNDWECNVTCTIIAYDILYMIQYDTIQYDNIVWKLIDIK